MNQIKIGATLNYIILGLNCIIALTYTPFMLRSLGQNEYGIYSLAASIIAYLTILDFGFGNAIVRYTAKLKAEGKNEEQYKLFGLFTILYSIIGIIVFVVGLTLYFNLDNLFGRTLNPIELSQTKTIVLLMIFNLAISFPLNIYGGIINAYEDFFFSGILSIIQLSLSTITLVSVLLLGYKAVGLVVIQTIFNIIFLMIKYLYCKKKYKIKVLFGKINMPFFKEISIYSFWIFLNIIMDKIYWNTGQFILGATSGVVAVSIFALAITIQGMYMSYSTAISGVFLPRITSMVVNNNNAKDISDLFIRTGRIQYIILAFILSGFIVFGRPFINLWASNKYAETYIITLIFLIPLTVPLIQNIGITILQARNKLKFRSIVYLIISLSSLALQIPLAQYYGGIGCAIAISIALLAGQIIIMNIYYSKKQQINIKLFWSEIAKMSIIPIIMISISLIIFSYFDLNTIFNLFLGISLFSIVYIPLFWKTSMNVYERELISKPFRLIISKFR